MNWSFDGFGADDPASRLCLGITRFGETPILLPVLAVRKQLRVNRFFPARKLVSSGQSG